MAHPILPPVHPGKILRQEYLEPLSMSAGELAKALRVPRTRIERLIGEKTALTPDTALRLAIYFKTTPEFWMNLQSLYDLQIAEGELADEIKHSVKPLRRVAG